MSSTHFFHQRITSTLVFVFIYFVIVCCPHPTPPTSYSYIVHIVISLTFPWPPQLATNPQPHITYICHPKRHNHSIFSFVILPVSNYVVSWLSITLPLSIIIFSNPLQIFVRDHWSSLQLNGSPHHTIWTHSHRSRIKSSNIAFSANCFLDPECNRSALGVMDSWIPHWNASSSNKY